MEEYIQNIQLDFNTASPRLVVYAKQGDADTRTLHVSFTKNGNEYKPSTSNSIMLRLRTPDGQSTVNNYTPNNDGTVDVTLTPEMLLTAGRAFADLVEYDGGENILSTMTFIVYISDSPSIDPSATSTDNNTFFNFIGNAQRAVESAQGYASQAAALASQMTMVAGEAAVPGVAPTLTIQDNQYVLNAPSVKYIPQVTVVESAQPEVEITVTSGTAGTGEESKLVKNLNFAFKLPSGVIPASAIGSDNIQDSAVTAAAISAGAVTSVAIASSAVTAAAISVGAVTTNAILDGAVTSSKIGTAAVESGALASGAVTYIKLADDAVRLRFSGPIEVPPDVTAWDTISPYASDYPYRGKIALSTERSDLEDFRPEVYFNIEEIQSGNFAPIAATYSQGVYIYAKEVPVSIIQIPMIELWR